MLDHRTRGHRIGGGGTRAMVYGPQQRSGGGGLAAAAAQAVAARPPPLSPSGGEELSPAMGAATVTCGWRVAARVAGAGHLHSSVATVVRASPHRRSKREVDRVEPAGRAHRACRAEGGTRSASADVHGCESALAQSGAAARTLQGQTMSIPSSSKQQYSSRAHQNLVVPRSSLHRGVGKRSAQPVRFAPFRAGAVASRMSPRRPGRRWYCVCGAVPHVALAARHQRAPGGGRVGKGRGVGSGRSRNSPGTLSHWCPHMSERRKSCVRPPPKVSGHHSSSDIPPINPTHPLVLVRSRAE